LVSFAIHATRDESTHCPNVVTKSGPTKLRTPSPPAQPPAPADGPFAAGSPLELSDNAHTYGGFRFAERIAYDEERDLYVVVNAGIAKDVIPNDVGTMATSRSSIPTARPTR
jgi:hypothetical protein